MNLIPLPNRDPVANNGFNYVSNIINPQHRAQQLVRIDYSISDNTKLYTRFNHEGETTPYPYSLFGILPNAVPYPTRIIGAYSSYSSSTSLTQVVNPATTNEVVFAATHLYLPNRFEDLSKVSRKALGYPYQGIFKNNVDRIPNFLAWGNGGVPSFWQLGGFDPEQFTSNWLISANDNFSKVTGKHTLKFGGFFQLTTDIGPNGGRDQGEMYFSNSFVNSTHNAYADLLLGRVGYYTESSKNHIASLRQKEISFFAQDSWKTTRRLTLEFGTRFYHLGRMSERHGYISGFDAGKYDPDAPINAYTGLVARYKGDNIPSSGYLTPLLRVGPRFGFAYDLSGKGNTVLRGGFGSFLYRDAGIWSFFAIGNPPLLLKTTLDNTGHSLADLDHVDPAISKPDIKVLDFRDDRLPTTYSWNLTLSHRLPGATILEASYVGNSSHNQLTGLYNINSVPEGAMFGFPKGDDPNDYRPFSNYGSILLSTHILTQNYNSLQVTFNRQARRINFAGSYTFSKALGTSGFVYGPLADSFDFRGRSYGILDYDRTHTFSIAFNIFLPSPAHTRGLRELINGWQISGISQVQSGVPLRYLGVFGTMTNGDYIDQIHVTGTPDTLANPRLTCDPHVGLSENRYANPDCFAAPTPGGNGPYQMPYLKQPIFQNHDLSVFKNFALSSKDESRKLQLRFSAYTFVNHPNQIMVGADLNLNFVDGILDRDSIERFGWASEKKGRRLMQFAIKFTF